MKHRCEEFTDIGKRCPGRHPWELELPDPDDLDPPLYFHLPDRNRPPTTGELFGLEQLAAEAFLLEWQPAVPWRDQFPKAAIDYRPFPGYFLPDPLGDRHVDYPTEPAFRATDPDPTVLVRGRYYQGANGYAAELFAIAAAALLGVSGAYVMASGNFQNLSSYMMGRYLQAPAGAGAPGGSGYFFEAPNYAETPDVFYNKYTATAPVGEQPASWYGGETQYTP